MKKFANLIEEIVGATTLPLVSPIEETPEELTLHEVSVAVDSAMKILESLESGSELEEWQHSKITLASEYLAQVASSMPLPIQNAMEPIDQAPSVV